MDSTDQRENQAFDRYLRRPTRRSLERVVLCFHAHVWNAALRVTGHEDDAADITQDVFLSLLLQPPEAGSVRSPRGYLTSRVVTLARRRRRAARRREHREKIAAGRILESNGLDAGELETLQEAIDALPKREGIIIELRYLGGLRTREIAETLGLSDRLVAEELRRGREALRSRLEKKSPYLVLALDSVPERGTQTPPPELRENLLQIVRKGKAIAPTTGIWLAEVTGALIMKKAVGVIALLVVLAGVGVWWSVQPDSPAVEDADGGTSRSGRSGGTARGGGKTRQSTDVSETTISRLDHHILVVDEEDKPIDSARVSFKDAAESEELSAVGPGLFSVSGAAVGSPGGILRVEAEGFFAEEDTLAESSPAYPQKIVLMHRCALEIRVTTGTESVHTSPLGDGGLVEVVRQVEHSLPAPAAEVYVFRNLGREREMVGREHDSVLVADRDGRALMDGLRSTDKLFVYAVYESSLSDVKEVRPASGTVDLLVKPCFHITGTVSDEEGRPIAGAELWLEMAAEGVVVEPNMIRNINPEYLALSALYQAKTDERGGFTFRWHQGMAGYVCARAEGYLAAAARLKPSAEEGGVALILKRGSRIEGYVLNEEDEPILKGARFFFTRSLDPPFEVELPPEAERVSVDRFISSRGWFRITQVESDTAKRLIVKHDGPYKASAILLDEEQIQGRRPVVFVLERDSEKRLPFALVVDLIDAVTGRVIPWYVDRDVTVRDPASQAVLGKPRAATRPASCTLDPGEYEVHAAARGFREKVVPLTVERGAGKLSTDPGWAEQIVLRVELERDPAFGEHIFHDTVLTVELVDSDSETPLPEGQTAWWSAARLPHGTQLFRRGDRIRLREGSATIGHELFQGDYEIEISVAGYRDAAVTVRIPEGSEEEEVIRVALEREWKDEEAARSRLPHIVTRLKYDREGRSTATDALISIGEAAVPSLLKLVIDRDTDVRFHAVAALGRIHPVQDSVIPTLVRVLRKDEAYCVRFSAASALGDIGPAARAAVPALIQALGDEENAVRCHAALALGSFGPAASEAVPALREACQGADENLHLHAEEALAKIRSTR